MTRTSSLVGECIRTEYIGARILYRGELHTFYNERNIILTGILYICF